MDKFLVLAGWGIAQIVSYGIGWITPMQGVRSVYDGAVVLFILYMVEKIGERRGLR